jgi:hypothetical protein
VASNAAKEYQSRGFLNSDKGMAAFEARTQFYHTNFCYGNFTITDCKRQIDLDFDYSTAEERALRTEKIDNLIQQLQKFREQLLAH